MTVLLTGGGLIYAAACLAAFAGLYRRNRIDDTHTPSVSVIIAARNEEGNIGLLIEDILAQDFPPDLMQIIAVDDCSTDTTPAIIRSFTKRDTRIRIAETHNSKSPYSHKKRAVHEGILNSDGEIVITVDADCRVPRTWIRGMVRRFVPEVELVAGAVAVEGNGMSAWLEALEFSGIQAMAAGLMNIGFPITCNGANLAYRRSAFERVGGFQGIGALVSGDDDLLMQKIARGNYAGMVFAFGKETAVRVEAARNFGELMMKRVRWASKIRGYPSVSAIILLAFFWGFFVSIPVGLACALSGMTGYGALVSGYGLKTAGDLLLIAHGIAQTGRLRLLLVFPIAEILHPPYIIGVTIKGFFGGFHWRGRRIEAFDGTIERTGP